MKPFRAPLFNRFAPLVYVLWLGSAWHAPAFAAGTAAGTDINNTATVDYVISGSSASISSNTATLRVDEKLDVNLSWQDSANVSVNTPSANRVLSFLLTNTGNGTDSYNLAVQNNLGGDAFDPGLVDIYLDANANGLFEPGVDTLYNPGSNDPVLGADASLNVFVRNDVPAGLNGGDLGNSQLTATSTTLSGTPGASLANAGDNNTTAVVGASGANADAVGTYEVINTNVSLVKSVVVSDPLGGNQPMPGATLSYRIDVSIVGSGTASGVVITDPIPANTTYTSGTLSLNGSSLSDGVDADAGDVDVTNANTVTVDLGDLTPASPVQTILFEVTIN